MKIQVNFKTPDAVYQALQDCVATEEEKEEAKNLIKQFVKWGEYISIEFDTNTREVKVLPH